MPYVKGTGRAKNPPAAADFDYSAYVYDQGDEHMAAALSYVRGKGTAKTTSPQNEGRSAEERTAIVAKFDAIPRTNYATRWNQCGRKVGTALWKAACRQKIAEVADDLFRCSLKHRALPGSLEQLAEQAAREWAHAHKAMTVAEGAQ